jgi:inner membrane protein YidH
MARSRAPQAKVAHSRTPAQRESSAERLLYFAAERTIMAWIRTAAGLMALGFVIDRFSFFLRQLNAATGAFAARQQTFWAQAGPALAILGALMATVAAIRYLRFAYYYGKERRTDPGHGLYIAVLFSIFVAAAGFLIAAVLLTITD